MHTGSRYSFREFIRWTRRDLWWLVAIATIPTVLHAGLGWRFIALPWVPIALIGTAAAFLVGFKNNASYNRLWEARQVWGAIVNSSRTWAVMARDFVQPDTTFSSEAAAACRQRLVYRQIAWLTALRHQLRQPRAWESVYLPHNVEYRKRTYTVPEHGAELAEELVELLSASDHPLVLARSNRATQILALQSSDLAQLAAAGLLEPNRHVALTQVIADLYDQQGKCERIKNFPYPRQFATINLFFIRLFVWVLPLGLLHEFSRMGHRYTWMTIPASVVVGWVFTTMERVGEASENPFEGSPNDVPITALSRTIEIDLRELLGESEIPPPIAPHNDILL